MKRRIIVLAALSTLWTSMGAAVEVKRGTAFDQTVPEDAFDDGPEDGPGPEAKLVAEEFGITPEKAQTALEAQAEQYLAVMNAMEPLGDRFIGGTFDPDFVNNPDVVTVHVKPEAKAQALAALSLSEATVSSLRVVTEPVPDNPAPDTLGLIGKSLDELDLIRPQWDKEIPDCDNDHLIEAGRVAALKEENNSYANPSQSGCPYGDGPTSRCTSGFTTRSPDGIITAGHCRASSAVDTLNVGWAIAGECSQCFSTIGQAAPIESWFYDYNHDFVVYQEKYENTDVHPRVYLNGQIWRNVTMKGTSDSSIWTNMPVFFKGAGWLVTHSNDHVGALKHGTIRDITDGGVVRADANFFTIDMASGDAIQNGDSGAGVYYYLGGESVRAVGIAVAAAPGNNMIAVAEKTWKIEAKSGALIRLVNNGVG